MAKKAAKPKQEKQPTPTAKEKTRPKGPQQQRIPGTERKDRNEEIEQAAVEYVEIRDERMRLTETEVALQDKLVIAMKAAKLSSYRCDDVDLVVEMSTVDKAKVRKLTPKPDEDGVEE